MVDRVVLAPEETGPTPPTPETPTDPAEAWRPEGFQGDQAALAKSWADQRAEVTRLQQALAEAKKEDKKTGSEGTPSAPTAPEIKEGEDEKPADDAAKKVIDAAGVDVAPFSQEFAQTGDVSEENRAKLADKLKAVLGDSARAMVDQYVEGQKVLAQSNHQLFMQSAGGEDQFKEMVTWAKGTLPKEQIEAYNRAVNSGDRHATIFAIEGLKAKFEAANGRLPTNTLKPGASKPSGTVTPFANAAQMTAAMKDPRYKKDQAYRDEVAARVALSNF